MFSLFASIIFEIYFFHTFFTLFFFLSFLFLSIKFPHATSESIELLQSMLAFNPKDRISVTDALHHSYLVVPGRSSTPSSNDDPEAGVNINFEFEDKAKNLESIRTMILEETEFYR